jgi:ATP-dependent Clp protease protease subunit
MQNNNDKYQEKVKQFVDELNEKFKSKPFLNKFNRSKENIEKLIDCPVKIDIDFTQKFQEEYSEISEKYDQDGLMEDFDLNYHNTVLREINEYGLNMYDKSFYFFGHVEDISVSYFVSKIESLNQLSPEIEKPITIHLTSYGGDAYSMFGIIDYIMNNETPINTVCYGQVMSAGAYILIAGSHRKISKRSIIMLHDLQATQIGSYKDITDEFNHIKLLQKMLYEFLEEKSNKDSTWWENRLQRNVYLTPQEALELNLIDEII